MYLQILRKSVKKYPFSLQKNADVSIFDETQGYLSRKDAWLPTFLFVDSNRSCKDLLFPCGLNLALKPLYLVGRVLKFPTHGCWSVLLATLYHLMLQTWYQNFAHSLVNMLLSFSSCNRLPLQQYDLLKTPLLTALGPYNSKTALWKFFYIINFW